MQAAGTGRSEVGGGWQVAGGGRCMVAEIMTSVDIIVCTLSLALPPRRDLTMPHGYVVDNCSLRFCRNGGLLDLAESRSLTRIVQQDLLPTSHRLWACVYVFSSGLLVIMVMVILAMVMVLLAVTIVPEVLRLADWLRQCQHQGFQT
jgi:hypothetical protein